MDETQYNDQTWTKFAGVSLSGKFKLSSILNASNERALVLAASKGVREAFHSLYEIHRDRIYSLLYHLVGETSLAEDLLQEVFLKAYKALPRFRFESSFSTWIYRIALNEAKYQKRQAKNWLPIEEIPESLLDRDASPDQLLVSILEERQTIVQHALLELPAKLRVVLILKYVDDLSYEEIAEILQCSTGTVASRLNRALQKLERKLRPFERIL